MCIVFFRQLYRSVLLYFLFIIEETGLEGSDASFMVWDQVNHEVCKEDVGPRNAAGGHQKH